MAIPNYTNPKKTGIPVATKDMKFKYICKYCQKGGLAWKVIDHKWILFDTIESAHVCQEKKNVVASQISNLTKTKKKKLTHHEQIEEDYKKAKTPAKKSPLKEQFDKLEEGKKESAAKEILDKIKKGDNALKALADETLLVHKGNNDTPPIHAPVDESGVGIKTNPKSKESKVKLKDAKELYQPVYGSSQSSTYYVVALYEGLKFAARVKGGGQSRTISIRVEGKAYTKLKGMSGLQKFNDNGAYGSIHLNVETVYEAKMVICGLIGGIDMEALTPLPDLTNIAK